MRKEIVNLSINPGVYTEQTERGSVGMWHDADKVRFRKGMAEKIGGWVQKDGPFLGTCRRIHDWNTLEGKAISAIATDTKLYLWRDETLYDITPLRDSGTLTNPFDTTNMSTTVVVNHTAHGAQVGDYVRFTGASAGGGITVDGEYQIDALVDSDSYQITDDETATSTVSGTGGMVSYEYDISAGAETVVTATGYGTGGYGAEGYGNARTGSTIKLPLRTWSLDNWGEDLLACPAGGGIYWWDKSTGVNSRAVLIEGNDASAPLNNQYIIISQRDRHLLALGAYDYFHNKFDPLLIRWTSTEDLNDWIPSSTNTAGDLRLYRGSKIVTGVRSRLEILVFTDVSVHTLPFVGAGSGVFGLNIVGENVSILGPNCAVPVDHRVFFMAEADFYMYDGVLKVLPCTVRNFVYENLNIDQKDKIYGGLNREFNEIWWFYPSRDPDSWVQQDFSLGLPSGYSLAQASVGGTIGYSYTFNSAGFTTITSTAANNYEHVYVLSAADAILDPTASEYAVELAFDPATSGSRFVGMTFLYRDLTGTPDTDSDDAQGIFVEVDYTTDAIRVRKKGGTGAKSVMDNDPGDKDFTTALGQAAALDTKYIITAQVNGTQVTVWIDGTQVIQFNLSAAEAALYTSGAVGLHAEANADNNDEVKFYNLAAGPVGVLTDTNFDISPIEVNRYVMFNYEEGTWSMGKMARTAWADRSPQLEKAYATAADGYIYQHETGTDEDGTAMIAYIESYDTEIPGAGEQLMHVDQLIPDFETLQGVVDLSLTGRKYPQADRISKGPYTVTPSSRKVSTRMRARQVALRVESNTLGDKWRMGTWRARVGAHGKRG
jgi:hypothetical protein